MPSVSLKWDISKKLFSVPVRLSRKISKMGETSEYTHCDIIMHVDTGSGISSITDKDAYELGLDVSSLEKMPIGGIGGLTNTPIAHEITLFFLLINGEPFGVNMEKISISPDQISNVREKSRGVYKQTNTKIMEIPRLLGLDVIDKMCGVLILNLKDKIGEIKF
jgi:hypothetical protein